MAGVSVSPATVCFLAYAPPTPATVCLLAYAPPNPGTHPLPPGPSLAMRMVTTLCSGGKGRSETQTAKWGKTETNRTDLRLSAPTRSCIEPHWAATKHASCVSLRESHNPGCANHPTPATSPQGTGQEPTRNHMEQVVRSVRDKTETKKLPGWRL